MQQCDHDEELQVLRQQRRAQRSVNKQLRRVMRHFQNHNDELFLELCNADSFAQVALEKIRTLGGIECGPSDYDLIVDKCLTALSALDQKN